MRPYKLTKCIIPESRRVIEYLLSILTLHRNTMSVVEKYVRNTAEDVRGLQTDVSSIHNGQKDVLRSYEDCRARQESQAQGNDLSTATF